MDSYKTNEKIAGLKAATEEAQGGAVLNGSIPSAEASAPIPSFRTKPWVRAVSVVMSVLLAATMFDASSLSPAVRQAVAAPQDEVVATEDTDQETAEGQDEAAATQEDTDATASEDGESDPVATPEEEPTGPTDEEIEAAMASLYPEALIPAEAVVPQATEGTADIESLLNPSLSLYGAPLSQEGAFLVRGNKVSAALDMGNLSASLQGGVLGGTTATDAVILTFDVPYLYETEEGVMASTFSEERWRVLRGSVEAPADTNGPRAALYADSLPEGWVLYQQHGTGYVALDSAALAAGVSGRIVARWEGNGGKLDAAVELPVVSFTLLGKVSTDATASVAFGYEAHSYTPQATEDNPTPETLFGTALRKAAGTFTLAYTRGTVRGSVAVQEPAVTDFADGLGYLTTTVTVHNPKDAEPVNAIALGATFAADWQGRKGIPLETLMAYVLDETNTGVANVDASGLVITTDEQRRAHEFVGVPGAGGVIVADVTELSAQERRSLDPQDPATFEALGVGTIPYVIDDEGRIQLMLTGDDAVV